MMKIRILKLIFVMVLGVPFTGVAQKKPIDSRVYQWREPMYKGEKSIMSVRLFEGEAHDFSFLQMYSKVLLPTKAKVAVHVPATEEHLLIIKSGTFRITIRDSAWVLGPGSVALLMPGERYSLHNKTDKHCSYFEMKYRSKLPVDVARGKSAGGSIVRNWDKIAFRPHDRGGLRNYFNRPTAMCKKFEMHVTTLNEGIKSHEPHTHKAEEIVLVIDKKTEMQIGEKFYKGGVGDIYYLGSNVLHAIQNDGKGQCTYFAFQFE